MQSATRVWNFSAGPAMLPEPVLQEIRETLPSVDESGMSAMELTHRGSDFSRIVEQSEADLRALLGVPEDYHVLFLQGGATAQFAMVPLNLAQGSGKADYLCTGHWSKKAIAEAKRHCEVNVAADGKARDFARVPDRSEWVLDPQADYVHYTPNETIHGLRFPDIPDTGDVPLVADYSSAILSEPLDVKRFGLIYAGFQKNIGPAGLTLVIVHENLVGRAPDSVPSVFDYAQQVKGGSLLNTPPTFVWYVGGLVFRWLREQGGLEVMAEHNREKAALLYTAIDESGFYTNPVEPAHRSLMNVPFRLLDPDLEQTFQKEAAREGLVNLSGHRSVGGLRASIYNAMPREGVEALVEFMKEFERRYG